MNPIDRSKGFTFAQLNKITNIVNSKPGEEKKEILDNVTLTRRSDGGEKEVLIIPNKRLMRSNLRGQDIGTQLKKEGIEVKENIGIIKGTVAKVSQEAAEKLQQEGFMVFDNSPQNLLPNIPARTISDGNTKGKPWDMPEINDIEWTGAGELHKQGYTGKGGVIAIIDSGYNHPEVPLKGWVDVVDGYENPVDPSGHGTHVAGDAKKTAPDAELVGIRVMNDKGQGKPSDIVKGIEWAVDHQKELGIDTINLSLGAGPDGLPYYWSPINMAVEQAIKMGIDVIAAAGNSGPGPKTIGSPADDPQGFTIGSALDPHKVSDFSSRGPTDDNLNKPDIIAPGEFITSWAAPNSQLDSTAKTVEFIRNMSAADLTKMLEEKPHLIDALGLPKDIMEMSDAEREKITKTSLPPIYKPTPDTIAGPGTSFASPETTGIVTVLKEAVPGKTPEDRKKALMETADSMGSQYTITDQGSGFIDADEALEKLQGK